MTFQERPESPDAAPADLETQASQAFIRRLLGSWSEADESELTKRRERDPAYASAFQRVENSWAGVGRHAASAELMVLREQALSRARRSNSRRWRGHSGPWWSRAYVNVAAVAASLLVLLVGAYEWAPFGVKPGEYRTSIAEQRVIELEDHSRIALDAATRLRIRFSADARIVELIEGQAQFSVARDPQRPFKVQVGERTIVALGTKFTVGYIDREFNIAMLEGRVAVISDSGPVAGTTNAELSAGEGLEIDREGQSKRIARADLKAVNAWREGKVIFNAEPLGEAIRRLNRYSSLRIEIGDPALASMRVSGVFDVGDTQAFVEAVQGSIAAVADYSQPSTIRLSAR